MKRCLIIDDDELSRLALERLVQQSGQLELVKSCSSPIEGLRILQHEPIDLLLLDVEMPELSGLELIRSLSSPPAVVLVTSKETYALEAFETEVVDYLVKPVSLPRFMKAVDRALSKQRRQVDGAHSGAEGEMLYVKHKSQLVGVPLKDILWVEATGDYVTIHTDRQTFLAHITLNAMERKLPEEQFMRVHRSHIVQLRKIRAIEETHIIIGKALLRIGESYHAALMNRLNRV